MKGFTKICVIVCMAMISCAFLAFGVYAATSVTHTTSGKIKFSVKDVFIDVNTTVKTLNNNSGGGNPYVDLNNAYEKVVSGTSGNEDFVSGNVSSDIFTSSYFSYSNNNPSNVPGNYNVPINFTDSTVWAFKFEITVKNEFPIYMTIVSSCDNENVDVSRDRYEEISGTQTFFVVLSLNSTMYNVENVEYCIQFKFGKEELATNQDFFTYAKNETVKTAAITDFDSYVVGASSVENVIVPLNYIDPTTKTKYQITSIADQALCQENNFKSILLHDNITFLGLLSLSYCANLEKVTLPQNITAISMNLLAANSKLNNVTIPNNVSSIGQQAFAACNGLEKIFIPGSVKEIGDAAFIYCGNLKSVVLPESVTTLGSYCFDGCALRTVNIPASLTSIGGYVFANCYSLKSFNVNSANPNYSSLQGILYNKSRTIVLCYPGGKETSSLIFPDSVTIIRSDSIYNYYVKQITIGENIKTIGSGAFVNCKNLSLIEVDENNLNYCSKDGVLFNKELLKIIAYPLAKTQTSYNIPAGVTNIGNRCFEGQNHLESVSFPNGVTGINGQAFSYCVNLKSVVLPDSVLQIGVGCFEGCTSLKTAVLGKGIGKIGYGMFVSCTSLTSVTFSGGGTWYKTSSSIYTGGEVIDISNPETNATAFKVSDYSYYLYKA